MGYDFLLFWQFGQAFLAGQDPYAIHCYYPPVTLALFSMFASLPYLVSFSLWTGINIILYTRTLLSFKLSRWSILAWFFFVPSLFTLLSGQLDIFLLWLALRLEARGWQKIAAGTLLTLKPQAALIVLPWYLFQWLKHDRRALLAWLGATLIIQALPLLVDPGLYGRWLATLSAESGWRAGQAPGIFSLTNLGIPSLWLVLPALALALWGLLHDRVTGWIACLGAIPVGQFYDGVFLANAIPWKIAVPLSWAAFGAAVIFSNSLPFMFIPLGFLAARLVFSKKPGYNN